MLMITAAVMLAYHRHQSKIELVVRLVAALEYNQEYFQLMFQADNSSFQLMLYKWFQDNSEIFKRQ